MAPVAFIPARGGSKRLPRKALADLGGKPLLAWTVEAAREAGIFGDVVVCSEDTEILAVGSEYGASPVLRPPTLSGDDVTLAEVISWYGAPGPIYVLLPTSPFRSADSIRAAWATFRAADGASGLLSVSPVEPPEHLLRLVGGRIRFTRDFGTHRAHLQPTYRHDGGHWIVPYAPGHYVPFHPPQDETLDINTPQDLDFARWTLAHRRVAI